MKSIKLLMAIGLLLSSTISFSQVKNSKTTTVKVWGNCGMCKQKIESAGSKKSTSKTVWDSEKMEATITYDSTATSVNDVLNRIALVGYDNAIFFAPTEVYNKLHGCCQYERPNKDELKLVATTEADKSKAKKEK